MALALSSDSGHAIVAGRALLRLVSLAESPGTCVHNLDEAHNVLAHTRPHMNLSSNDTTRRDNVATTALVSLHHPSVGGTTAAADIRTHSFFR